MNANGQGMASRVVDSTFLSGCTGPKLMFWIPFEFKSI